ncbi:hypothetical protein [Streptomyces uncialis]|nr:hypothetical protein [Streptomyces uncialis]MCX4664276.1 hypothetical protein [Streptomyces uncialis]
MSRARRRPRYRVTLDGPLWGGIVLLLAWGSLMVVVVLVATEGM